MLLDAGKSSESIAEYLFLSGNTVTNYLKKYQTGGLKDLVSDDYQGSECRLSKVQQRKLAQHLEETLYQTVSSIREQIRYYERFADFKAAILSFFANVKQYRPELESLMTLKFHTLGT